MPAATRLINSYHYWEKLEVVDKVLRSFPSVEQEVHAVLLNTIKNPLNLHRTQTERSSFSRSQRATIVDDRLVPPGR